MSIPSQAQLLAAAIRYLNDELLPTLHDEHRFKVRVLLTALAICEREQSALQSQPQSQPGDVKLSGNFAERELCQAIRSGQRSTDDALLRAELRANLERALTINNPRWLKRSPPATTESGIQSA